MFGRLLHKYQKRSDGKTWNRSSIVSKICEQIQDLNPKSDGNSLSFANVNDLRVDFITDQYSSDEAVLQLNGTIFFGADDGVMWADLISLAKIKYGKKYRALSIRKDQAWKGSNIEDEAKNFFGPLFRILADRHLRHKLLIGEPLKVNGQVVQIPEDPDFDWLKDNSQRLLD